MLHLDRNEDDAWMRRALLEAERAAESGEVPVGALVVREGVILGTGHNQPIGSADPTAHAEVVALRRAAVGERNYRVCGATVYVSLEPCAMCVGALLQARVARVVFGARDPKAGALGSVVDLNGLGLNHRLLVTAGVLANESAHLLREFFRRLREQRPAAELIEADEESPTWRGA
jgi:tRNA(adenine34) deaminase